MTKCIQLRPAMCRRDLLPSHLHKNTETLFADTKNGGITAFMATLYNNQSNLFLMAGIEYIAFRQDYYHFVKATELAMLGSAQPLAANFALELMTTQILAGNVKEIDGDYEIFPDKVFIHTGQYKIFYSHACAIISVDAPRWHFRAHLDEIEADPDSLTNRAPLCTIVLNETESHHQRITQPGKVLEALDTWKHLSGMRQILNPTEYEIIACENNSITEKNK